MAFFGIFLLAWVALLVFIIIICVFLLVFVPCLVISIISLVKGIKYHWPMWSRVLLSVSGTIVTVFLVLITWYLVWRFGFYDPSSVDSSSTSEMIALIPFLPLL